MGKERKNRDIMSLRVRAGDLRIVIETLLTFLKDGTEPRTYRRPLIFPTKGTLYNAGMGLEMSDGELFRVKKVEVVPNLIERTTEKGDLLLRCLFSLPYVQEVRFHSAGDFEVIVYPPFDLNHEITAGLVASEIKASVDRAAGKKLSEVGDIMAEELFEEKEEKK